MADEKKEAKKRKRPTAEKRNLQNIKRRTENRAQRSEMKTVIRRLEEALEAKASSEVKEKLSSVYSILDKNVKRGIIKKNKASRTKARLAAKAAKV